MLRIASFVIAVGLLAPAASEAAAKDIGIGDDFFSPKRVGVRVGSTVRWTRQTGSLNQHNVRQTKRLFRSGDPTLGAIDYTVVFSAGTFPYYCEIHRLFGMSGVIRVPVRLAATPAGRPFTVRWATKASNSGSIYDVQFRVAGGAWRTWRSDVEALKGVFGKNGRPVTLKKGTKYSFRARSQHSVNARRVSRWSPVRSFRV